jgi:hypothetical protein
VSTDVWMACVMRGLVGGLSQPTLEGMLGNRPEKTIASPQR